MLTCLLPFGCCAMLCWPRKSARRRKVTSSAKGFITMRLLVSVWFCFVATLCWRTVEADQRVTAPPKARLYSPVADDVYLQEIGRKVPTNKPVTALAAWQHAIYAVRDGVLCRLHESELQVVKNAPAGLSRLFVLDGKMWGTTADALYRFDDGDRPASKVFDGKVVDMCIHNGTVHAAHPRRRVSIRERRHWSTSSQSQAGCTSNTTMMMADGTQVLVDPVRLGPIERIASYSGTLYLLRPGGPTLLDGAMFVTDPVDWGTMPSRTHRGMRALGSRLLIATDRGVAVLRGAALTNIAGKDGLPYEDTTCLAAGFDGDVWIGTTKGAIRNVGNKFHYFGAHHWLPGDNVHDIVVDGKTVYVATDAGIGIIRYEPYTLRKKAAFFEQQLAAGGHKRLGFVHELYRENSANGEHWLREISDNDGGHTAHYLSRPVF